MLRQIYCESDAIEMKEIFFFCRIVNLNEWSTCSLIKHASHSTFFLYGDMLN